MCDIIAVISFGWIVGVYVHLGSFSALGISVSLQIECVMDTETAHQGQMKLSVQVKVCRVRILLFISELK